MQKRLVLVCEDSLCPKKQPDVSGPGLGEAGRYRMVSEPTFAVSRTRTGVSTRACGRARNGSVRGHLGCAVGTGRTDVAQGPLALDARTWHMGCWHWTYGTWLREDVPGLGLTDEDVGLLRGEHVTPWRNLGMGDRPGSSFRVRTSEDKVSRKN